MASAIYGLLLMYLIYINFALFIFCNKGGARKALVSGIVGGGHSESQILYGFFSSF
jgi:hypothetical protein